MRLSDRKIGLITGGAGGIGRATAEALAADGFAITLLDRPDANERAVSELGRRGIEVARVDADVSSPSDVELAVGEVVDAHGRLDVLVNAAGLAQLGGISDITADDWDRLLDVNLKGTFLACRAAYPVLRRQGKGAVVNVASVSGRTRSVFTAPNYVASKAGVIGLTMSLAAQWCVDGIRVNCVAPGLVDTDMTSVYTPDRRRTLVQSIPMGRFARPAEIADAIVFLTSERSSYVTGETLNVNGGLFMV